MDSGAQETLCVGALLLGRGCDTQEQATPMLVRIVPWECGIRRLVEHRPDTMLDADDQFDTAATLLVFASKLLGVSVAVADIVVGRLADAAELVEDAVLDDLRCSSLCGREVRDGTRRTALSSLRGSMTNAPARPATAAGASDLVCTAIWLGVRTRGTAGGVRLLGELFDCSQSAVPAVGDVGQRTGCLGEALFPDLVADFASLTVSVDQSDSLQEREVFGYRLSTDGHVGGEGCRSGLTAGNEEVEQFAAGRIGHRFP